MDLMGIYLRLNNCEEDILILSIYRYLDQTDCGVDWILMSITLDWLRRTLRTYVQHYYYRGRVLQVTNTLTSLRWYTVCVMFGRQ